MNDESPLTPDERERLQWCLSILDEENVVECQDEADQLAYKEAMASKAYFDLLPLLVKLRVQEIKRQEERQCTL
jgi:hypothetical protein